MPAPVTFAAIKRAARFQVTFATGPRLIMAMVNKVKSTD